MTREQFDERIRNDYNTIVEKTIKDYTHKENNFTYKDIAGCAYPLAHYNEVYDIVCESECFELTEDEINEIIAENGERNLVEKVFDAYLNYNHPERYNFFQWEDLVGIVKDAWGI